MPRISGALKALVATRAGFCCEYCKSQLLFSPTPFSAEHIIPFSKGGSSDESNLAFACQGCNNHKYNHTHALDPVTGHLIPLFNPRNQRWDDHFSWNAAFTEIIGITGVGRATVERLKLNRPYLPELRRVLHSTGDHPPKEALTED